MADAVVSFPDVGDVQQKLPSGNGESSAVTASSIPLSVLTQQAQPNFNIQMSSVGGDGMFNVTGATKPFKSSFKSLGGNWDNQFYCWKFDAKYESQVKDLISAINSGKVQPEGTSSFNKNKYKKQHGGQPQTTTQTVTSGIFGSSGDIAGSLPVIQNKSNNDFQTITYNKVFCPRVGMFANIKRGNLTEKFQVTKVGQTGINVDSAYINTSNGVTELVVIKGHWRVNGLLTSHNVFFSRD